MIQRIGKEAEPQSHYVSLQVLGSYGTWKYTSVLCFKVLIDVAGEGNEKRLLFLQRTGV